MERNTAVRSPEKRHSPPAANVKTKNSLSPSRACPLSQSAETTDRVTWIREEFEEYILLMSGSYRYTYSKFAILLGEKWPLVRQIVAGATVTSPLSHVEIHTSEPCQLNCRYCRGGLRNVPQKQKLMLREDLIDLIDDIHALNPRTFIRFSG